MDRKFKPGDLVYIRTPDVLALVIGNAKDIGLDGFNSNSDVLVLRQVTGTGTLPYGSVTRYAFELEVGIVSTVDGRNVEHMPEDYTRNDFETPGT